MTIPITMLRSRLLASGGFTADADGRLVNPAFGYAVSLAGYESRLPIHLLTDPLLESVLVAYAQRAEQTGALIGAWLDDGLAYFDLSEVVHSREYALSLARLRNQRAVYDFAAAASIYLDAEVTA